MILAAGRGERMRPLTDQTPKPLLDVGGLPLLGWHLQRLAAAGIHEVVINHAWLGEQIVATLGNGAAYGVNIAYSAEASALETAGGIAQALPLLGPEPFLLLSGDIFTDYDFGPLRARAMGTQEMAHLVMVANPPYHPRGDFALNGQRIDADAEPRLCYANIGVCRPELVAEVAAGSVAKLGPLLVEQARAGRVSGEFFDGLWINVGTPQDLQQAQAAACQIPGSR